MEGSKLILPKNPTEKFLWAPKKGQFLQKTLKMAYFGPFLTQKWAIGPKLSILTKFFCPPPHQTMIEEKSVKISVIYVLKIFQYGVF